LAIFFVVKNPFLFQSSILSLEEKAFINSKWRDAAYKISSGSFEIFLADKHASSLQKFQGYIYYEAETLTPDTQAYTGQGVAKLQQKTAGTLLVTIQNFDKIDSTQEIIGIPFSGNMRNIVLGESKGMTKKGRQKFSVGNLGEFTQHAK
jgi:hypothetical protein